MKLKEVLSSDQDWSVNFVFDNMVEARFVRRTKEYFIVYLSSHTGCNKACRFCHLTQTGQTSFDHVTIDEYLQQAREVLSYYRDFAIKSQGSAEKVNFNFMARGEPLSNIYLRDNAKFLINELDKMAKELNLETNFNISSIMPTELREKPLVEIFQDIPQIYSIYYSLYSVDEGFRKRWLPKSLSVDESLKQIKDWHDNTGKMLALHWAFIEGENDKECQMNSIIEKVREYDLNPKFNLVRYNPYSENQGVESSEEVLNRNFNILQNAFNHPHSRIVPRVGFDVKASCGMFVSQ